MRGDGDAAAVVTKVPATPSQTTAPAADRNRRQPMCMPPSNRITTSATVTTRSTVWIGMCASAGTRSEATAAPIRKIAGAGMRRRALIRLDSTATRNASDTARTITRTRRLAHDGTTIGRSCGCGALPAG